MAFDVYAGTFTRFYTRAWENAVQKQARLDGAEYRMIYAGGDPGPPPDAEEVRSVVDAWRSGINQGLSQHLAEPLEWPEDEAQPYYTDRPGWQGYSGLLLWAAYVQRPDLSPPYNLPDKWMEDHAYLDVLQAEDGSDRYPTLLRATVWIPGSFNFCFKFPALAGDGEVMIASTKGLLEQLERLEAEPAKWAKQPFLQRMKPRGSDEVFQEAATEGLRVFKKLATQAVTHRLPMMLSF